MREKAEGLLLNLLSSRMARHATSAELMPKYTLVKHEGLDESEKCEINKIWQPMSRKIDYRYWEVYKGMFGFNPLLVPDDIYVKSILRVLNPMRKCYALQSKSLYQFIYNDLHMPATLVNCIDGQAFDDTSRLIDIKDIPQILANRAKTDRLIIKPSADSCSGNGVSVFSLSNHQEVTRLICEAGANFVIQEVIEQSELTKKFCSSSLNTFRINTIYINGKISVENIMFRHGQGNSVVDNAGAGGVCIGFDPDGKVIGKAIDAKLNSYETTPFGTPYASLYLPQLQAVSATAMDAHLRYLPMMGHAAWDFALDKNDNPVFIEVNLGWPGVMTEQLSSCRPIFGSRTQEVIDFALNNKTKMSFTDFIGHWT